MLMPIYTPLKVGPSFRFFQLDVTASNSGVIMFVYDMRFLEADGTAHPTSNMTSNTAPSPLVASASSDDFDNFPYFAFDGSASSGWAPDRPGVGSCKIDLGSGNEIVLASATILAPPDDASRTPKTFTIEGSNTGDFSGEETVLITQTNISDWSTSTRKTFTVD